MVNFGVRGVVLNLVRGGKLRTVFFYIFFRFLEASLQPDYSMALNKMPKKQTTR